jgi:hypothetical protein
VAGEVARFAGHVAKFLGDGVLAYFGWPRADEHDAERAVRAGLATVEAISQLRVPPVGALACRVGIATGLVVVGNLTSDRDGATGEGVVGKTPNLAARRKGLASPGEVVVCSTCHRLCGGIFVVDELGPRRLHGFTDPVPAFRLAGERSGVTRFEARRAWARLPLVGRDQELALLLDRWRQACTGEGQTVLLSGEAGIGKSRIVHELLDRLHGERLATLLYQCSPFHTATPLWPVIRQLEHAVGFALEDGTPERLAKLERVLARGIANPRPVVPLVAALLGLDSSGRYPPLELAPQRQRARTLEVLLAQVASRRTDAGARRG